MKGKVVGQSGHTITVLPNGTKARLCTQRETWQKPQICQVQARCQKQEKGQKRKKVKQNKNSKGKRDQEKRDVGKWSTRSSFPDEGRKIVNIPANNEETKEEEMESQSQNAEETDRNETEPQL